MNTIQSLAGEVYDSLETRTRDNGEEFVCKKDGTPEWIADIIRIAHGDAFPDDTVYAIIQNAAGAIHDHGIGDGEDPARDAINEMEADPYTSNLTKWLHERADFVLLQLAQKKQIKEVGFNLIDALLSRLEETEDED